MERSFLRRRSALLHRCLMQVAFSCANLLQLAVLIARTEIHNSTNPSGRLLDCSTCNTGIKNKEPPRETRSGAPRYPCDHRPERPDLPVDSARAPKFPNFHRSAPRYPWKTPLAAAPLKSRARKIPELPGIRFRPCLYVGRGDHGGGNEAKRCSNGAGTRC